MPRDIAKYQSIVKRDYEIVAGPDWPSYAQFQTHKNIPSFVYDEIDTMLPGKETFDNPAFCVLPFYGFEIPTKTPCCLLPPNYNIEQIQTEMLQGIRPNACNSCWRLEDAGIKSDRLLKNETLDFYFNRDLKKLFDDCVNNKNIINHYKIDTSNICNSTCITCQSQFSSAWAQLERKNKVVPADYWKITPDEVDELIDYKTAQSIGFRGGEPFLSDTNFYILEQLLKHNNDQCFINFTTNGSSEISSYQKDILSKFKNVNFCFSIDGVDKIFEYLRYPLKWETLENNIRYCRENNIIIGASYTISNLNILYHEQTVNWFNQNQIPFLRILVEQPRYFRPSALSQNIKNQIINNTNNLEIQAIFNTHTEQDDNDFEQFKIEIAKQDQWKGIQMKDYLPKFAQLLNG